MGSSSMGSGFTYLRRPPFTYPGAPSRLGRYAAHPILVLGDDVTTDHISPAGAIPPDSETGRYLVERGENPGDLNVYAARRGNYEAMVRGSSPTLPSTTSSSPASRREARSMRPTGP